MYFLQLSYNYVDYAQSSAFSEQWLLGCKMRSSGIYHGASRGIYIVTSELGGQFGPVLTGVVT